MNARAPGKSTSLKAATRSARLRRPGCRDCPFHDPSGRCLDPTLRSGRCGDWVWYVLPGNKQHRRLWVKPRDPRTPKQRHWRTLLGAASMKYSEALTDEQQDACIAAGAGRRSRPRLGQSGWLTGQQYWVGKSCGANAQGKMQKAAGLTKGLQTKGISQPTWEPHLGTSGIPPAQHRGDTGRAGKGEGRRQNEECSKQRLKGLFPRSLALGKVGRALRCAPGRFCGAQWSARPASVPAGRPRIAQRFNAGWERPEALVPKGRLRRPQPSLSGLGAV